MIDLSTLSDEDKERLASKEWRMSHLYKIRNADEKTVTFIPNEAQKDFEKNKHTRNIILKSRRLGFTTFEAIDTLDDVLFNKNKDAIFIAHTDKEAVKIFQKILNYSWENFPLKQMYSVRTDKANELRFDFKDGTFSSVAVTSSGRSGGYGRVHISEFAKLCKNYPSKAEEVILGTIPAVPFEGRIDIESTAEGEFGEFYDMFWAGWGREPQYPTEFKSHFYNWTWDKEKIDASFKYFDFFKESKDRHFFLDCQKKLNLTDKEITFYFMQWVSLGQKWWRLRQEFPFTAEEAFISSGNKVFESEELAKLETKKETRDGAWYIYEDYKPGCNYVMGADVALGVGQDSSTAVILKLGVKAEVVALFKDNTIPPDLFAHELKRYGVKYGGCMIAPERNNMGDTTVRTLLKIYPNVFKETNPKQNLQDRQTGKTQQYGFLTTSSSKPHIIGELRQAINEGAIIINSQELINELRTYDKGDLSKVTFDPNATAHWDLMMALCIAYYIRTKHNQNSWERPTYNLNSLQTDGFNRPSYGLDSLW